MPGFTVFEKVLLFYVPKGSWFPGKGEKMIVEPFNTEINFTSAGDLKFFFLGVGSAFAKKNFQTNLIIIKGQDHLLVDCGNICPYAFYTYSTPITKVKNILVTHSHADPPKAASRSFGFLSGVPSFHI